MTLENPANGYSKTNTIRVNVERVVPDIQTLDRMTGRKPQTNPKMASIKNAVLAEALDLIEPVAIWSRIEPENFSAIPGSQKRSFSGLQALIGAVCSIGGRLEKQTHHYFETQEYALGYFLDMVGTLSVAKLAQIIGEDLRGQYSALHWAPGDDRGDVDLESQRFLFNQLPAQEIGIQLTENNIMLPIKSLSFFLAIGEQISGLRCSKSCSQCALDGMCDKRLQRLATDEL